MKVSLLCILLLVCLTLETQAEKEKKHGFIMLHGLASPSDCNFLVTGLRLNRDEVRVECPVAKCRSHPLVPLSLINSIISTDFDCIESWFNFRLLPAVPPCTPPPLDPMSGS